MGGLLTRGPDGWRWRDGTREARARDLTAAEAFQFPRVTYPDPDAPGGRSRWVSLPVRALDEEPDLSDELTVIAGPGSRLVLDGLLIAHRGVRVIGAYFPNGQEPGSEKFEYKMEWLKGLRQWVKAELETHPQLVLMGDFNCQPSSPATGRTAAAATSGPARFSHRAPCAR